MSGPNPDWFSPSVQLEDEPVSSEDAVLLSPCKELRRLFTRKEKDKKKMLGYETG